MHYKRDPCALPMRRSSCWCVSAKSQSIESSRRHMDYKRNLPALTAAHRPTDLAQRPIPMPLAYLVEQFRTLTYLLPVLLENDVGSFQEHIRRDRNFAKNVFHDCAGRQLKPLSQLRFVPGDYASVQQGRSVRLPRPHLPTPETSTFPCRNGGIRPTRFNVCNRVSPDRRVARAWQMGCTVDGLPAPSRALGRTGRNETGTATALSDQAFP
jgi:hypothetical protein